MWKKNGVKLSETGSTLSFTPLRLSDAGRYTCNANVNEVMHRVEKDVTLTSKCVAKQLSVYITKYFTHLLNYSSSSRISQCYKFARHSSTSNWSHCYSDLYCGVKKQLWSYQCSSDCEHSMDWTKWVNDY